MDPVEFSVRYYETKNRYQAYDILRIENEALKQSKKVQIEI